MNKGKNQPMVKHTDGLADKGAGNGRTTKVVSTQTYATNFAKKIAKNQNSEMFIHGRNGRIRERNSNGKDPFP